MKQAMSARNDDAERGALLVQLRHGLRKSSQLAQHLATDPLLESEAHGLLGRLNAIRAEVETLEAAQPRLRHAENDPFWTRRGNYPDADESVRKGVSDAGTHPPVATKPVLRKDGLR